MTCAFARICPRRAPTLFESTLVTGIAGYLGLVLGVGLLELVSFGLRSLGAKLPYFSNPGVNLRVAATAIFLLIGMGILEHGKRGELPVQGAGRDDGNLFFEVNECLVNPFRPFQGRERARQFALAPQLDLPFAIVTKASGLEHSGKPQFFCRGLEFRQ